MLSTSQYSKSVKSSTVSLSELFFTPAEMFSGLIKDTVFRINDSDQERIFSECMKHEPIGQLPAKLANLQNIRVAVYAAGELSDNEKDCLWRELEHAVLDANLAAIKKTDAFTRIDPNVKVAKSLYSYGMYLKALDKFTKSNDTLETKFHRKSAEAAQEYLTKHFPETLWLFYENFVSSACKISSGIITFAEAAPDLLSLLDYFHPEVPETDRYQHFSTVLKITDAAFMEMREEYLREKHIVYCKRIHEADTVGLRMCDRLLALRLDTCKRKGSTQYVIWANALMIRTLDSKIEERLSAINQSRSTLARFRVRI